MHHVFLGFMAQEQFVVDQHGYDGSNRTEDGRRLRAKEVCTAELHDDRETAHKQRQRQVLQNLCTVGHHKDKERRDEEHQRELQNNKGGHLAEHFG